MNIIPLTTSTFCLSFSVSDDHTFSFPPKQSVTSFTVKFTSDSSMEDFLWQMGQFLFFVCFQNFFRQLEQKLWLKLRHNSFHPIKLGSNENQTSSWLLVVIYFLWTCSPLETELNSCDWNKIRSNKTNRSNTNIPVLSLYSINQMYMTINDSWCKHYKCKYTEHGTKSAVTQIYQMFLWCYSKTCGSN